MAPAHRWPPRSHWAAALFQESEGVAYCSLVARDYPAQTFEFRILESTSATGIAMVSTKVSREVKAQDIQFAADGFPVMVLPAKSIFARMLTGEMGNAVFAKLDDNTREKLWQIFLSVGVVTASASFGVFTLPTEGFSLASADFEKCLGELELVAPAPIPNTGLPE
jgi:hypothetical protein